MRGVSGQPRCLSAYETKQLKNLLDGERVRWLLWSYLAEKHVRPENCMVPPELSCPRTYKDSFGTLTILTTLPAESEHLYWLVQIIKNISRPFP